MASRPQQRQAKMDWALRGSQAVDRGDLEMARVCFGEGAKAEPRNPAYRYNLALVLERMLELDAAAVALAEALRLKPQMAEAARHLSNLLRRYQLGEDVALDPFGLRAALAFGTVEAQAIGEVAAEQLMTKGPLAGPLSDGRGGGWLEAARGMVMKRTAEAARNELFIDVLERSVLKAPDLERLLTAVRRVLLSEVPADRFQDRALFTFTLALARQLAANEHVWAVSAEEEAALQALAFDRASLLAGDGEAGRRLLLATLYRPIHELLAPAPAEAEIAAIRPKALKDAIAAMLEEEADIRARAGRIPRLTPIEDETSRTVAAHYEASPYPRWKSLHVPQPGSLRRGLGRFFTSERLAFMDRPFEVLVAGAGTGYQAVLSAFGYGPQARITGIDLSAASLGYADRMRERLELGNLRLAQADILKLAQADGGLPERFEVIEAVGVLHHAAEPFTAWRLLADRLAPGGLMYVGLYSAVSRKNIVALREDPAYPGSNASAEVARAYRADLLARAEGERGAELVQSKDFYTLSEFRDLALHPCESQVTLPQIEAFLQEAGLAFRGFTLDPAVFAHLQEHHIEETWPGSFARWAWLEETHPRIFDGMYSFWCEKS